MIAELNLKNILNNRTIIGYITIELLTIINEAPRHESKEKYIHNWLTSQISGHALSKSFDSDVFIIYDEVLPVEILIALHTWLGSNCCNISNVVVITTHTLGATDWYNSYSYLLGERNFRLLEAPFMSDRYTNRLLAIPPEYELRKKEIKYWFSYYGGNYSTLERDFLTASYLNNTITDKHVDYLAGFKQGKVEFNGYLEQISGFRNRGVNDLLSAIQCHQQFNSNGMLNETFNMSDNQYQIDSVSACQIIRETMNNTPYTIVTEKTLRSFLHGQHAIPFSGKNSVSLLEKIGFQFDHALLDYSYQSDPIFYNKVQKVNNLMIDLANNFTLSTLGTYINSHPGVIHHNYNYVASGKLFLDITKHITEEV